MVGPVAVYLLPEHVEPGRLGRGIAVVIDVLRASTTITWALAAGATRIIPCLEVDEARRLAAARSDEPVVLGGERGGQAIDAFDLDNSPASYTPESVSGRTIVFTTTNGTKALWACSAAGRVLVAGFANINSVIETLVDDARPVVLCCAGTDGAASSEDSLCAGALVAGLEAAGGKVENEAAELAREQFRRQARTRAGFLQALADSPGGKNLQRIGCADDIELAAEWDRHAVVGEFDSTKGEIRSGGRSDQLHRAWIAPPESE